MSSDIVPFRATGPRTDRGKRMASVNALKHGLYAVAAVVRGVDDPEEYRRFARQVVVELGIDGALEMALAERIISALWRLRRVRRYETEQLSEDGDEASELLQEAEKQEEIAQQCSAEATALWSVAYDGYHVGSVPNEMLSTIASGLKRVLSGDVYDGKLGILLERRKPVRLRTARAAFVEAVALCMRAEGDEPESWSPETCGQYARQVYEEVHKLQLAAERKARDLRKEARSKQTSALMLIDDLNDTRCRTIADTERRLERQLSRALDDFWKHRCYNAGASSVPRRSGRSF